VMKEEALGFYAAGKSVEILRFLGWPEGCDRDVLRVAALEGCGTVNAWKNADLSRNRTKRFRIATVGTNAASEHRLPVGFVLEIFEDDVEVDIGEFPFAELGEQS